MKLRQSTVNDFMICGKRTEFRLNNPDHYTSGVMRTAGTGYHAGLANLYLNLKRGEAPDLEKMMAAALEDIDREIEHAGEAYDWRYQPETKTQDEVVYSKDDLVNLVEDTLHTYVNDRRWWPSRYEVLDVERFFEIDFPEIDGWTRQGTFDLSVRDTETGWVHVVDHKLTKKKWYASKAKPSASVQAAWYVSACQKLYETEAVTFTYDVMTTAGDFSRIEAHRTKTHIDATLAQAAIVAEAIEKGGPFIPNTTSFLCHEAYCDWWSICPFGRALSE